MCKLNAPQNLGLPPELVLGVSCGKSEGDEPEKVARANSWRDL